MKRMGGKQTGVRISLAVKGMGTGCLAPLCDNLGPGSDLFQRRTQRAFGDLGIVGGLRAKPVSVGQTEKSAQPQIGIRRYRPFSTDNLADALGRYADFLGQPILAQPHGFQEFFRQDFSWGYGI